MKEGSDWIITKQPDIVAFQELNGIAEEQLEHYSVAWNHPYAITHKETGFPVGLTSREPIQVIERNQKGGHHGYLHCRTYGMHFFVVHFWPGVLFEIDRVTVKVRKLLAEKQKVVILGDFNGCSRKDTDFLKTNATLRKIDFEFVDRVEAAGLVDRRELVRDVPAQRAELPPLLHQRVEERDGEDQLTPRDRLR